MAKWVNDEHPQQISTFLTLVCSPEWATPVCPEGTPVEVLGETERGWRHAIVQKELPDMEHLLVLQGKVATVEKVVHCVWSTLQVLVVVHLRHNNVLVTTTTATARKRNFTEELV